MEMGVEGERSGYDARRDRRRSLVEGREGEEAEQRTGKGQVRTACQQGRAVSCARKEDGSKAR